MGIFSIATTNATSIKKCGSAMIRSIAVNTIALISVVML